jgi:hypothetical protein
MCLFLFEISKSHEKATTSFLQGFISSALFPPTHFQGGAKNLPGAVNNRHAYLKVAALARACTAQVTAVQLFGLWKSVVLAGG